jgi:hypothetical protein
MEENKVFWLIGKVNGSGEDWDVIGLFDTEQKAKKNSTKNTFYYPLVLNKKYNTKIMMERKNFSE